MNKTMTERNEHDVAGGGVGEGGGEGGSEGQGGGEKDGGATKQDQDTDSYNREYGMETCYGIDGKKRRMLRPAYYEQYGPTVEAENYYTTAFGSVASSDYNRFGVAYLLASAQKQDIYFVGFAPTWIEAQTVIEQEEDTECWTKSLVIEIYQLTVEGKARMMDDLIKSIITSKQKGVRDTMARRFTLAFQTAEKYGLLVSSEYIGQQGALNKEHVNRDVYRDRSNIYKSVKWMVKEERNAPQIPDLSKSKKDERESTTSTVRDIQTTNEPDVIDITVGGTDNIGEIVMPRVFQ